jgi:ribosomal protein S18 acetylase RimI-like enzyme
LNLEIETIELSQISRIKNLWERLNKVHLEDSTYFKDHYANLSFDERCENFSTKSSNEIQIDLLADNDKTVGYCISTINNNIGEIDSLFIADKYRKSGYGKRLVERCMDCFGLNNCEKIQVSVAEGHESVFGFYEQFGFYPRLTYLMQRKPNTASNKE